MPVKDVLAKRVEAFLAKKGCVLGMFVAGVALIFVGVFIHGLLPYVLSIEVHKNIALAEGKETFDKWKVTPIPVYFSVYFFNVTNFKEVESEGAKPMLNEVGPYVFKQMRRKEILKWDKDNLTVTYKDLKTYYFVPELSKDPDTMIHTLNMPLLGLAETLRNMNFFLSGLVSATMDDVLYRYNNTLFVHKPARILLFEGYKVEFLEDLINLVSPFYKIPNTLPNNTFAFLYGKNNSGDGIFSVYTGEDDISKYTQIKTWNNHSHLTWWENDYCDMLNGTDGGQFPPPISKEDILYVYTAELCRSVYLQFREEVAVKGIPAYRFVTPHRLFASPTDNPDNQCYCTRQDLCFLSGILDITSCRNGIPLAVTAPHFYLGHEAFVERIDGLHPSKEQHETYVDIEPMTGVVLRASRKLQMNYLLQTYEGLRQTRNAPNAVFPLLWIIEGAEVDDEIANMFNAKVRTPVTIAKSILTACIVLGLLWIITAGFVTVYILIKQQKATEKNIKAHYKSVPAEETKNEKTRL